MSTAESGIHVVLPTYNEADNLEPLVAALLDALPAVDADPVRRRRLARRHRRDRRGAGRAAPAASTSCTARKEGLGPAYVAGFRRALAGDADLIVQMDADFSHDPGRRAELVAACEEADLALGSRYVEGGGVGDWGKRAAGDLALGAAPTPAPGSGSTSRT